MGGFNRAVEVGVVESEVLSLPVVPVDVSWCRLLAEMFELVWESFGGEDEDTDALLLMLASYQQELRLLLLV